MTYLTSNLKACDRPLGGAATTMLAATAAKGMFMRVFLTGATGFIGRALILRLRRSGHTPVAWVRSAAKGRTLLGQEAELVPAEGGSAAMVQALCRCDAVVNLAGENIAEGRWTEARKQSLVDSRVKTTQMLVARR
ncbi:MAG: NAD-dependent epimerase/dehydratase family protein [Deltaproteobacteria bacterium]|nr:MAG: NAD-dependent epimerase/dehydratase family protein [Deltaproteobacteria bacterium]